MKKIIAFALTILILLSVGQAWAYNFPEPDWGALLKEKEYMVMDIDFELYTEGDISSAPCYGAKLEPYGGTYLGMSADSADSFLPLGSYLTYIDTKNQTDLYYPSNEMISDDNVVVTLGWNFNSLDDVDYDTLRTTLNNLADYNKPMLIRFANEMNCSSLGDDPDYYISVFKNVANMIHEYDNFAIVWSPNDLGSLDRPFEYYYPGDEYVDWVGVSCYMIKYFMGNHNTSYKDSVYFMTGDYSWATNRVKPVIDFMERHSINKPVMISEGGVSISNPSESLYEEWSAPRLKNLFYNLIMKYPQIKLINYFNIHRHDEREHYDISPYSFAVDIFKEAANSGAYKRSASEPANFVYERADNGSTISADENTVRLYTLAYFPQKPEITVNYSLDGVWVRGAKEIPYTYSMDISQLSDGAHTLKISAEGTSKEYTFFKTGSAICFGAEPEPAPQNEISVVVNDEYISFPQAPVIVNDRTLVPLRAIFEALNADVYWNADTQTVTAVKGSIELSMSIGSNILTINGTTAELDAPAALINGNTMVPARAVAEGLDCRVDWDGGTRTVFVTSLIEN